MYILRKILTDAIPRRGKLLLGFFPRLKYRIKTVEKGKLFVWPIIKFRKDDGENVVKNAVKNRFRNRCDIVKAAISINYQLLQHV